MRKKTLNKSKHCAHWCMGAIALAATAPLQAQVDTYNAAVAGGSANTTQAQPLHPAATPISVNGSTTANSPGTSLAAAEGNPSPLNSLTTVGPDYRIASNDLIEFKVFGVPDMQRDVRVNASGELSLPLIGAVAVAGLTAQTAEQRIAAKYKERYLQDPQVSLFIKEFTTQRIAIEGAVIRPGIYPVTGQLTLLRALALSGGFAPYADINQIVVYRSRSGSQREQFTYDLDKVRAGSEMDPDIRSDDVIVVQRNARRAALRDSLFRDILDTLNPFR
jgi:polysaccharide export outer membrane protein